MANRTVRFDLLIPSDAKVVAFLQSKGVMNTGVSPVSDDGRFSVVADIDDHELEAAQAYATSLEDEVEDVSAQLALERDHHQATRDALKMGEQQVETLKEQLSDLQEDLGDISEQLAASRRFVPWAMLAGMLSMLILLYAIGALRAPAWTIWGAEPQATAAEPNQRLLVLWVQDDSAEQLELQRQANQTLSDIHEDVHDLVGQIDDGELTVRLADDQLEALLDSQVDEVVPQQRHIDDYNASTFPARGNVYINVDDPADMTIAYTWPLDGQNYVMYFTDLNAVTIDGRPVETGYYTITGLVINTCSEMVVQVQVGNPTFSVEPKVGFTGSCPVPNH